MTKDEMHLLIQELDECYMEVYSNYPMKGAASRLEAILKQLTLDLQELEILRAKKTND